MWDIFYKQVDLTLSLQVDPDGLRPPGWSPGAPSATAVRRFRVHASAVRGAYRHAAEREEPGHADARARVEGEKTLEARAKEMRAKEKRAAEAANAENNTEGKESWEENVKAIEEKFWETVGGRDSADAAPIE